MLSKNDVSVIFLSLDCYFCLDSLKSQWKVCRGSKASLVLFTDRFQLNGVVVNSSAPSSFGQSHGNWFRLENP